MAIAKLKPRYLLATAFMLAHPYGYPQANHWDAAMFQVGKKCPVAQPTVGR